MAKKKRKKRHSSIDLLLSILSGVLLGLSWPTYGFYPLIFFAFVPLFFLEKDLLRFSKRYAWNIIRFSFVAFLIFCAITTWWIGVVSIAAGISAVLLNAIVMTFFFTLYHLIRTTIYSKEKEIVEENNTKRLFVKSKGQWILIPVWITFEFLHYNWDLNFPWLTLGNVFSENIKIIQWYEITGVFGGTLWILIINYFIFRIIETFLTQRNVKKMIKGISIPILIFVIPVISSLIRYYTYKEEENPIDVVVYQPNSDPLSVQFNLTNNEVVDNLFINCDSILDENVDFILGPESALQESLFEHELDNALYINRIRKGLQTKAPNAALIIGASTYKLFNKGEPLSETARPLNNGYHYDAYNTTFYIDSTFNLQLHHKSCLTPGVEIMPYIGKIKILEKFALDLGGTVGSLGTDTIIEPFNGYKNAKIGSLICYESIFGNFITKFVRNGANVFFVSTNDGWWGDTQGYKQHCSYSRILAVETRRSVARSANTGRSCTVNQRGDIFNETEYWVPAVFRDTLNLNEHLTFYARFGDYIAIFNLVIFIVLFFSSILKRFIIKKD